MTGALPIPRYKHGDTVWVSRIEQTQGQWPCPDCLGSGVWKVTTPAGEELECSCQRCGDGAVYSRDIPTLHYTKRLPHANKRTIGSVRIDTAYGKEHPVEYMCRETGTGNGSVYYEELLHDSEEAAFASSAAQAETHNTKELAKPAAVSGKRVSYLRFTDVRFDQFKNGLWSSWYQFSRVKERLEELMGENSQHHWPSGLREEVEDIMEGRLTPIDYPPIGKLLSIVQAVADSPWSLQTEAKAALAEIPEEARRMLIEYEDTKVVL